MVASTVTAIPATAPTALADSCGRALALIAAVMVAVAVLPTIDPELGALAGDGTAQFVARRRR